MTPLPFEQARRCVIQTVGFHKPPVESVFLSNADGRVLAQDIAADREYPPFARAIRDGYAIRAEDAPNRLRIVGEVRAGTTFHGVVSAGEAVEIMTGAPVPAGANAVVMVEHTVRDGDHVRIERTSKTGEFIVPRGSELCAGASVVAAGTKLDFAHIAAMASVGSSTVPVFRRPQVAIIATGDELVSVEKKPSAHQIRNSNSHSLSAQVRRAGADPNVLPVARDDRDTTRKLIEQGLGSDLLLLSGGVSAGKYDFVEHALTDAGAVFYFDRVLIQPGAPIVFGKARGKFFFGLPGNPASTMVTFEIFARAAIDLLSGRTEAPLPFVYAQLAAEFRHKAGLTRFLPAALSADGRMLRPLKWQGSGDVFALAKANAFVVARQERETWNEGDMIEVLLR